MSKAQNPWEMDFSTADSPPWEMDFAQPTPKPPSITDRLGFGIRNTIDYGRIAATNDPNEIAGIVGDVERRRTAPTPEQVQMQQEYEPYRKRANEADGVVDTAIAYGSAAAKRAGQFVQHPREFAGMIAENLPNSLPGMAAGIAGAALGQAAIPVPGVGAAIGGVVGGTAGGYAVEQGSSMLEQIQKEAQARGINPLDKAAMSAMISEKYPEFLPTSQRKGVATAGTDSILNTLTMGVAGAGERAIAKEARALAEGVKDGSISATKAAEISADISSRNAAMNTLGAKTLRGAGVTGSEMVGEGLSEAAGQKYAYGNIDAGDVIDESLLGLGQGVSMAAGHKAVGRIVGTTDGNSIDSYLDAINPLATPPTTPPTTPLTTPLTTPPTTPLNVQPVVPQTNSPGSPPGTAGTPGTPQANMGPISQAAAAAGAGSAFGQTTLPPTLPQNGGVDPNSTTQAPQQSGDDSYAKNRAIMDDILAGWNKTQRERPPASTATPQALDQQTAAPDGAQPSPVTPTTGKLSDAATIAVNNGAHGIEKAKIAQQQAEEAKKQGASTASGLPQFTAKAQPTTLGQSPTTVSAGPGFGIKDVSKQAQAQTTGLSTTPKAGDSNGNQSSAQQEIPTQQIPGQVPAGKEGLLTSTPKEEALRTLVDRSQERLSKLEALQANAGSNAWAYDKQIAEARKTLEDHRNAYMRAQGQQPAQPVQDVQGPGATQPTQAAAPSKEENQSALDRIASGKAWFGNELKAKNWVHTNELAETHEVQMTAPRRFEVVPKKQDTENQVTAKNETTTQNNQPEHTVNTAVTATKDVAVTPATQDQQVESQKEAISNVAVTEESSAPENNQLPFKKEDGSQKPLSVPEKLRAKAAQAEQARADYFTPGNIVSGYGQGHDRVISYTPPNEKGEGWSVTVQSVVKENGKWVNDPMAPRQRTHATMPDSRELAKGPVERTKVEDKPAEIQNASTDQSKPLSVPEKLRAKRDETESKTMKQKILNLFQVAMSRKDGNKAFENLTAVTPEVSAMIKAKAGLDVSGYVHSIDESAIRHMIKNHGDEKTEAARGQSAITQDDVANIYDVVSKPDSIDPGKESDTIVFKKKIGDTLIYVQEVREGRKKLAAKTLWKVRDAPPAATKVGEAQTSKTFVRNNSTGAPTIAQPAAQSKLKEAIEKRRSDIREQSLGNAKNNANTEITKEAENDPAKQGSTPTLNHSLDEGQQPAGSQSPARGAKPDRAGEGRRDDGGVHGSGGQTDGQDIDSRNGIRGNSPSDQHGADGKLAGDSGRHAPDFVPAIGGLTREGSWFDTAKRNIDLIELAIKIESENRAATPEEQAQLSKYVGFGASAIRNELFPVPPEYAKRQEPNRLIWPNYVRNARFKPLAERIEALPREWQQSILQSSQYAHYTSEGIIRSVWSGLQRMGFTGGNVFEPGMGIGSFAMLMPNTVRQTSRYTGVEFDAPTALIARLLSPQQNMLHGDFIKRKFPKNFFDVNVGNPPFSQTKIFGDPEYAKHGFMLHDFFFAKGIDLVRPGGIQVFVTSKGTMDKQNDKARKYLAERADLLGAVRLPSTAFEDNAGTSVVTDVIFLRKRAPGEEPAGHAWGSVATVETKDGPVVVNEYFAAHPEMVLGQQRISGNTDDMGRRINSNGMGGERYTVVSYDSTPAELDAKFAKAIENLPENAYSVMNQSPDAIKAETAKIDFDPSIKREGVVYLGPDGTLMKVEHGVGKPLADTLKLSAKDEAWFKSYVGLRDLVQDARFAQMNDGDWESGLKKLNKAYDAFRRQHGPIRDYRVITRKSTDEDGNEVETQTRIYKNKNLWLEDYDSSLITALEVVTEDGNIVKAPFLLGRTIGKPVTRDVRTIGDALAVSLDSTGKLNLDDVANRMHLGKDEVIDALGNQIYQTPDGEWQLSDEYLSGNVVQKLDEAEEAARLKPELRRNVEALKQVQPEKLGPSQIGAKLGASWIPVDHVNEFSTEIGAGNVTFDPKTETWQVEGGNLRSQRKASAEYGTADRSPSELLETILNSRPIKITAKTEDGKTVVNNEATTAANEAAKKIKDKFKGWVWTDTNRASELVEIYNKRYNNIAPRKFDGSHLTLPGVSLRYKLHPHQLRAIWRIIQTGNTYLAHSVGSGKTYEMIAAGMEQKRLGLIKKPMYVVPNHMLEQFSNEFMDLYPLANIMVADDQNFSADKRKAFIASATLNNPDAIIITHDAFQRIGVKEESIAPIRDEILTDLELELSSMAKDQGARVRRSQLEQQIEAVKQRFDRILGAGGKDATIKFEDMGVDFVFADESHAFRKLDFQTSQQIKGIDPNGSKRALDMYIKTRILDKKNPGRSMVFASGTPVTNTMGELYTIMRFFAAHQMDVDGISTFDAWSRQFGEVSPALEPNAAGKYEMVERFAKFDNVPELMSRVRQFMDVLTSDNLGALIKRPDLVGGKPNLNIVPMSQSLKSYMQNVLAPRIEASKKWKPTKDQPKNKDPILNIITDGRFAAIDPRFFGGELGEGETSIINEMGDKIAANYHATKDNVYLDKDGKPEPAKGSTQIVFYNNGYGASAKENRGFDARAALTKRLTAGGIPRNEIAWFDDADTDAKKEAIFKDMRSGKLKVLIGSAKKMGTGVNVQKRLAVLHYQDPPWYPADVEQPHGRIIRQGNQNPEVKIEWYTTKGTYQSTMWQMVGRKQRFIDQAFTGDKNLRSMDDMGEASMFEQAAAVASGDPRAIQLAGLRQDVERFERLQAAHASEQINIRSSLRSQEWSVKALNNRINTLSKAFKAIGGKFFSFADTPGKVNGIAYSKPGEFGQAIKDAFNKVAADSVMDGGKRIIDKKIASLGDAVTVTMDSSLDRHDKADGSFYLMVNVGETSLQVAHSVAMGADVDASGLARRVFNQINSIDSDLQKARRELVDSETEITKLRKKSGAPFEYQQEMVEKHAELKRLEEELRSEGEAIQNQPTNVAINEDGDIVDGNQASEGDGTTRFSRANTKENLPPVDESVINSIINKINGVRQTAGEARIHVVTAPAELPVKILEQAKLEGIPENEIHGVIYKGHVYIVRQNLKDRKDVEEVLVHEVLGHGGVNALFGDTKDSVLLEAFSRAGGVVGLKMTASRLGVLTELNQYIPNGPLDAKQKIALIDEMLAQAQGKTGKLKQFALEWWNKVRNHIINALNAMGFTGLADRLDKFDAGEAAVMLRQMREAVIDGGDISGHGVSFLTAWNSNKPQSTSQKTNHYSTFAATANKAASTLSSFVSHPGTVSGWWKTVGSMYGLAQKHKEFKPVFEAGQRFLNDVSFYATEAATLAPTLLPKLENIRDIAKAAIPFKDNKPLADALFQGTLSWKRDAAGKLEQTDKVDEAGVIFEADELKSIFGMNDRQVGLYREARAAIDNSLDNTAKAAMVQLGGKELAYMRDMVMDAPSAGEAAHLLTQELALMGRADPTQTARFAATATDIQEVAGRINQLKKKGYAPLSRFGRYTVSVRNGTKQEYFGLFESKREANIMADKMRVLHPGLDVTQGTLSQKEFEQYQGITPETAELFGDILGLDQAGPLAKEAFQEYLRMVKNNRSALKRLIHRKGIAGYNEDVGRVLSAFIASNARKGASDLHLGDMSLAVSAIPQDMGELKDIAIGLQKYLVQPQEEAPAVRGMLFAQYIGGSVASAMVNLTQPMQVSMPYLSQFGGAKKATAALVGAYRDMATKGYKYAPQLDAALKIAEEEGIVAPQEIHQLQAQARGAATLRSGDGTPVGELLAMSRNGFTRLMLGWGKMFGLAEQVNRRATFIAAFRMAQAQGIADPAKFASKAVNETQFVNNKGNRMMFGRGPIGSVAMTFKSYGLNYLELLHRLATQNGTDGKYAAGLMLGMLMLMAGAGGLPFEDDLHDLIDAIAQRMGYNFSSKKAKQHFLEETFGKAAADFIDRGITGLPGVPIDMSLRMGMGNMIPGTGLLLQKADHTRDVLEIGGPALDFGKRLLDGLSKLAEGKVGGAILDVAPKALSSAAQGVGMLNKGYYSDTHGRKVIDTTTGEGLARIVGFQPQSVAADSERTGFIQRMKDTRAINSGNFTEQWAKGIYEGDQQQVQDAQAAIRDWNEKNPDTRITPNIPAILRRVREMRKTRDQRIIDSSPKAMRPEIRRELLGS